MIHIHFYTENERLFFKPKKLVTVAVNTTTWTGGTLLFTQSVVDFAFEATASLDPCICSYDGGANIHILCLSCSMEGPSRWIGVH